MKTKFKYLFFCFCLICATFQSFSQNNPFLGIPENINLPKDNLGVMPDYIVEVDDVVNGIPVHKLYVYGMQGILIYDLNNPSWLFPAKFEFTEEPGQPYGYFDRNLNLDLLETPARQPMIYVPEEEGLFGQLFAVGPDLRLWCIDVSNDLPVHILTSSSLIGKSLKSSKLVFDPENTRIMWLANAKSENPLEPNCYLMPVSLITYSIGSPLNGSSIITDFAINDDEARNVMYLGAHSGASNSWVLLDRDDFGYIQSFNLTFSPGLIKYVHTEDIHQVFCLPQNENTEQAEIHIFIEDSPARTHITIPSPVPGLMCAGFNDDRNHLFLGAYTEYEDPVFNDVFIYQCLNNLPPAPICSLNFLNTNGFSDENQNLPFVIEPVNENENLIMKRHEVVKLIYNEGSQCHYTYQSLLKAYGNYFRNAVITTDSRVFITSMSGAGFLEYQTNNNPWILINHQTGQPVHECFTNESSGKKYYFSNIPAANSHIFIDEDFTLGSFSDYTYQNPMGDCIYNPFQDHILISDFLGSPDAHLNAYTEVQGGLEFADQIDIDETHNEDMFITKDGKLLYFSGGDNITPKINILSAINYDLNLGEINLTKEEFSSSDRLKVLFAGNPYQNYFVLSDLPDVEVIEPYQQSSGISYFYVLDPEDYPGSPSEQIPHDMPKFLEVNSNPQEPERTKMYAYVGGSEPYISEIGIDLSPLAMSVYTLPVSGQLTAMKLVRYPGENGFVDELYIVTKQNSNSCKLYKYIPGSQEQEEFITDINSFISSMSFNYQTGLLYCYGADNLESVVYQFDVLNQFDDESQGLNLKRMFNDGMGSVPWIYPNEMLFDNENHQVNIPNGERSSISRLGFAFDRLHLKNREVSWISFPRLENNPVPAIPVLEKIRPFPSYIYMENIPLLPDDPGIRTITYQSPEWEGSIEDLQSTYGYKHSTSYTDVTYQPLLGSILDPGTSITIFRGQENWVGYFPTWPQDPFDALAPVLNKLTLIKHHDWACFKCQGMGPGEPEPTCWMCSMTTPIEYADMLILECTEDVTFQWGGEFSAVRREIAQPKHFVYGETPDYAPIFIELDTNDQPLEIGAFIGDSCIGATVFEPGDSAIMIRGYMPDDTAGIITFEKYYGSEKALPERISEYYVQNNATGIREKRTIDSRERSKYYRVSFKKESSALISTNPLKINFYPNPCPGAGTIEYFLPDDSDVTFDLLDVYGRKMNHKIFEDGKAGSYSISWSDLAPAGSSPGIYFIRMSACGTAIITKLIITE